MRKNLTKKERLKGRSDLERVFTSSKRVECRGARLLILDNHLDWNRVALCPVRRFKKAVERNREKRVFREIYRSIKHQMRKGYDLVFIIYPGKFSVMDRFNQVNSLVEQVGLKK